MYCVKCGVELAGGCEKCPLCNTKVYYPEPEEKEAAPYPPFRPETKKSRTGIMTVVSGLMLIPLILCPAIDIKINSGVVWSGYAVGGWLTAYVWFLFPYWFASGNPVVFFPADMLAAGLLMLYISLKTGGGWFMSFAFPVCGAFTALVETMIVLLRYAAKKKRHRTAVILGSGLMGLGALCVLVELLIHVTFGTAMLWWSFIPFTVLLIAGLVCVIVGSNPGLREAFHKKFFI